MIRDLAPLVGRRISCGVVPDWHGEWPLAAHPDFCAFLRESAAEFLLHGCFHRRAHGRGPVSWLAERSDEMNGLDAEATGLALQHGQRVFTDVFGAPARGFLPPAWQRGHVRPGSIEYVLGFLSLDTHDRSIPLATFTWDCGRWGWPGHIGHGIGRLLHRRDGRIPVLAIHPRDLQRGYWPGILRLTQQLLDTGHQPHTVAGVLEGRAC